MVRFLTRFGSVAPAKSRFCVVAVLLGATYTGFAQSERSDRKAELGRAPESTISSIYPLFARGLFDRFVSAADIALKDFPEDTALLELRARSLASLERFNALQDALRRFPYDSAKPRTGLWALRGLLAANKLDPGIDVELLNETLITKMGGLDSDPVLRAMVTEEGELMNPKLFYEYAAYKVRPAGVEATLALQWIKRDFPKDGIANELFAQICKGHRFEEIDDEISHLRMAKKSAKGDRGKRLKSWLEDTLGEKAKFEERQRMIKLSKSGGGS